MEDPSPIFVNPIQRNLWLLGIALQPQGLKALGLDPFLCKDHTHCLFVPRRSLWGSTGLGSSPFPLSMQAQAVCDPENGRSLYAFHSLMQLMWKVNQDLVYRQE